MNLGPHHYRLDRGFLVAAGLAECLEFLERFGFSADDLDWLESNLGLDPATLDAFAKLGFTGDVWAVPEGRVVLAGEPLLEVTAPIAEAQLVETALLNEVSSRPRSPPRPPVATWRPVGRTWSTCSRPGYIAGSRSARHL